MIFVKVADALVSFIGGDRGPWSVSRIVPITGASLPPAERVAIGEESSDQAPGTASWILRGRIAGDHYVTPAERRALDAISPSLGRPEATRAALIPIRKSEAWWRLPDGERREIFEESSHHVARSLAYLPRIARRLHHCHDLEETFDFLTWFEYAPRDESAFDELVGILRATEEWRYVEREVDIRLSRDG
jgi:chlorite dismutase